MALFDRAAVLPMALVLPSVVIALTLYAASRRRIRLARFGNAAMIARLAPVGAAGRWRWRAARLGGASLFGALALAGPRWGFERQIVRASGIDMVLAIDASLSMLATDERPSRLERVKQEVRRLRALSPGDRIGLIAFAGRSYILTPLTVDAGALELFLDNLDPSVVGQAGSSLSRAIRQGTDLLLATQTGSDRALIILSDGEAFETGDEIVGAARRARESGVVVVTVGFGTEQGANIIVASGDSSFVKRDEAGAVVVTRYHPEFLKAAAEAAGGTFVGAGETDKAARVRQAVATLRTQARVSTSGEDRRPRFQLFVAVALLLVLLDTVLIERRGRRMREAAASTPAGVYALLAILTCVPRGTAWAGGTEDAATAFRQRRYESAVVLYRRAIAGGDRRAETLYNLGTALVAAESLSAAVEVLGRATEAKDPELRFRATFNLGLAHLQRGRRQKGDSADAAYDAALRAYKNALLMRPSSADAKWNYELALRKKSGGGGGGGRGGGGGGAAPQQSNSRGAPTTPVPQPAGGIGQRQAERLLNSAAREERETQARKQHQNRPDPPPVGKDWE
ncbi:MAG: hypothetical protein NVS1B4_04670 [Gemmatimonadaceae bacterium]